MRGQTIAKSLSRLGLDPTSRLFKEARKDIADFLKESVDKSTATEDELRIAAGAYLTAKRASTDLPHQSSAEKHSEMEDIIFEVMTCMCGYTSEVLRRKSLRRGCPGQTSSFVEDTLPQVGSDVETHRIGPGSRARTASLDMPSLNPTGEEDDPNDPDYETSHPPSKRQRVKNTSLDLRYTPPGTNARVNEILENETTIHAKARQPPADMVVVSRATKCPSSATAPSLDGNQSQSPPSPSLVPQKESLGLDNPSSYGSGPPVFDAPPASGTNPPPSPVPSSSSIRIPPPHVHSASGTNSPPRVAPPVTGAEMVGPTTQRSQGILVPVEMKGKKLIFPDTQNQIKAVKSALALLSDRTDSSPVETDEEEQVNPFTKRLNEQIATVFVNIEGLFGSGEPLRLALRKEVMRVMRHIEDICMDCGAWYPPDGCGVRLITSR